MADSAFGTTSVVPFHGFGICGGDPETVEIVTMSPESIVISGLSAASKKPQCTVSGAASNRCVAMLLSLSWPRRPLRSRGYSTPRSARRRGSVFLHNDVAGQFLDQI